VPGPLRSRRRHWLPLLAVAAAVLVVDQVSKAIVRSTLPHGETDHLLGILRLHHTHNDGILGGRLSGAAVPLGVLTVVGVVVGLRAFSRHRDAPTRLRVAAGLLLGGAIGNMIDRLRLGYVTDFIARGERHAFNVADLAIYVGLGGLALLLLFGDRRPARAGAGDS
jgi:signal peptidase II